MVSPDLTLSGKGIASISRNAFYLLGSRWLTSAVRLVYVIVLTRYLGPKLYGLFSYGMAWYLSFLPITGLGLGIILSREVGRNREQGINVVARTFTIRLTAAIIVAATCGVVSWIYETVTEVRILLLIFSIALAGRALVMWTNQVFTAYEANHYSFRLQAIFRPLEVIFGISALFFGGGLIAIGIVHAVSWWLQALSGLAFVRRRLTAIRLHRVWRDLMSILVQGLPIGLGVILTAWLRQGPLVVFRYTAGATNSLGQLALDMQAFLILSSLPMVAATASLPVLSRAVARQDGKDRLFAETMLRLILIFGSAVALTGFGAGPWIVNLIFGPRYAEAGHLLGTTLCLLIPLACGETVSRVFLAKGQFVLPTVCVGAGALVFTLLAPWLTKALGTLGTVIATGAGLGIWALSLIGLLAESKGVDLFQAVLRPAAAASLAIGVFFILKPIAGWMALPSSLIALTGGTFLFGVLTPDDRMVLSTVTSKLYSPFVKAHDSAQEAKKSQDIT